MKNISTENRQLSEIQKLKINPEYYEIIQSIRIVKNASINYGIDKKIKFKWDIGVKNKFHHLDKVYTDMQWVIKINYMNVLALEGPVPLPSLLYHVNFMTKNAIENFLGIFATELLNMYYDICRKYWICLDESNPHKSSWAEILKSLSDYLGRNRFINNDYSNAIKKIDLILGKKKSHNLDPEIVEKIHHVSQEERHFYSLSNMLGLTFNSCASIADIYQIFIRQYNIDLNIKEFIGEYYPLEKKDKMILGNCMLGNYALGDKVWIQDSSISFIIKAKSHEFVEKFWRDVIYFRRFISHLEHLLPSHIKLSIHIYCSQKDETKLGKDVVVGSNSYLI